MVVLANILVPLYIYPTQGQGLWQKLTDAAVQYPDITFTAVVNPNNGPDPDADGCPTVEYINAINNLTTTPHKNIRTMGYVHTANQYNCGPSSNWICPCSRNITDVEKDISTYKSWSTLNCKKAGVVAAKPDIHMDSLFIDEAPNEDGGACLSYMTKLTNFAKSTTTGFVKNSVNGTVLFNPGGATDISYFNVADVIVILENDQQYYESIADIGTLNGNGTYDSKSSMIIYNHTATQSVVRRDVETILSKAKDGFASLYLTDHVADDQLYSVFPSDAFWSTFLAEVNRVAGLNK